MRHIGQDLAEQQLVTSFYLYPHRKILGSNANVPAMHRPFSVVTANRYVCRFSRNHPQSASRRNIKHTNKSLASRRPSTSIVHPPAQHTSRLQKKTRLSRYALFSQRCVFLLNITAMPAVGRDVAEINGTRQAVLASSCSCQSMVRRLAKQSAHDWQGSCISK